MKDSQVCSTQEKTAHDCRRKRAGRRKKQKRLKVRTSTDQEEQEKKKKNLQTKEGEKKKAPKSGTQPSSGGVREAVKQFKVWGGHEKEGEKPTRQGKPKKKTSFISEGSGKKYQLL